MRVLICGDRNWASLPRLSEVMNSYHEQAGVTLVIEGEARGADKMGAIWAESKGIPVRRFPADWSQYGRAAGPIRNQEMLLLGLPQIIFAFHDDLKNSKGTADMIRRAKKAKLPVHHVTNETVYVL
jgi:hypothetical protein